MEWTLDRICELVARPETLNVLNACRPGHPWNATARRPWSDAAFVLAQRPSYEVPSTAIDWLRRQAQVHGEG